MPCRRSPSVLRREASIARPSPPTGLNLQVSAAQPWRRFPQLSPGTGPLTISVHPAIAALSPGDRLGVRKGSNRWELLDSHGTVVGRLARSRYEPPADMRCAFASVLAIARWDRETSDPTYRERLRSETWEVVVPELVFEPVPNNGPQ